MPATMQIDQAGLPAGVPGFARSDGLDTGALVTVTNTGGGSTTLVQLLDVPDGAAGAEATLAQTGPNTWTFSPTVGVPATGVGYGSYRIELIVDAGLPTESRQIRWFGIRLPSSGLLIPAWNGRSNARASRVALTGAVDASEFNEPSTMYPLGEPRGWGLPLRELFLAAEGVAGGGEVLFRWNGVDVSQFKAAVNIETWPNPGAPATLVVLNDPQIGNLLRFETTRAGSAGGGDVAIWLINQSFPQMDLNQYRYVIRARIIQVAPAGGAGAAYGGFAHLCTDAGGPNQFGFVHTVAGAGASSWRRRIEAGAQQGDGSTETAAVPPDEIAEVELIARHDVSVPPGEPDFILGASYRGNAGTVAGNTYRQAAIGAGAFGPNWDLQTLDRIGLALQEAGGGAPAGQITMDIADLAVIRHPIDR
jgi:hypothetical protein